MLALFRRFLSTWVARVFFVVLIGVFALWGVNDMVSQIGTGTNIASVDGQAITPAQFSVEFSRAVKSAEAQAAGGTLSANDRKNLGNQVLGQMIYSAAVEAQARRMGLAVSDGAVRQQIWAIKAFQINGKFDQATFTQVLSQNNLNENDFIATVRKQLLESELLDSLEVGAGAPAELTNLVFGYEAQTRTADVVLIKRADQAQPPDPTDLQLHRFYDNNLALFATPEYRKIKLVVLSTDTLASSQTVTDAEAKTVYNNNISTYVQPEKRSVQVLVFADQAKAQSFAAAWNKNPDWTAIQKQAQAAGGSGVEIDSSAKAGFPVPALADAVFAAAVNQQIGPVQAGLGWQVARVIAITPPSTVTFAQAEASIKSALAREKAASAIYDQANKLEDAIGASSDLDQVPSGIGAAAAEGTLDGNGVTLEGTQAPIPASGDLRAAILADAFSETAGQPAEFKEVPGKNGAASAFYAMTVESITPPAHKSFQDAEAQVRSDWIDNQRRHEAEIAAAQLLTAVQGGQNIATAAGALPVIHSSPFDRNGSPANAPPQIVDPIFAAAKGETTMVETNDGFAVAQLTNITTPARSSDPIDWDKLRSQLAQSTRADIENTYTDALRSAAKISVNQNLLNTAVQ